MLQCIALQGRFMHNVQLQLLPVAAVADSFAAGCDCLYRHSSKCHYRLRLYNVYTYFFARLWIARP
jgi:hypothetical protein